MATSNKMPMRMSVRELMKEENSDKKNSLLRAWKRIAELPPENPNSFHQIAGFHGEPFVKSQVHPTPDPDNPYWGGFCQHANVLFPLWHRLYLVRLEQALQTVDPHAMIPYWDQTSSDSLNYGIPKLLTDDQVVIDNELVDNPLKSFTLKQAIADDDGEGEDMSKPKGYPTVRYPFAGLVGPKDKIETANHNNNVHTEMNADGVTPVYHLNQQIRWWLDPILLQKEVLKKDRDEGYGIRATYIQCLQSPNYNEFSNTSTSKEYLKGFNMVSLESPHNWMHLAVGGASFKVDFNYAGFFENASGDMMFNETAGFDPIFYFHHCNIDRIFWVWQKQHDQTDELKLIDYDNDPGVIPIDGQGLTPYQYPTQKLTLDTPLHPFQQINGLPNISRNAVNIEKQLNYTYSIGDLDEDCHRTTNMKYILKEEENDEAEKTFLNNIRPDDKQITSFISTIVQKGDVKARDLPNIPSFLYLETIITVSNIKKDVYPGSFVVYLIWNKPTPGGGVEKVMLGRDVFLNRINREICANCQQRPNTVTATFDVSKYQDDRIRKEDLEVKVGRSSKEHMIDLTKDKGIVISVYRVYKPKSIRDCVEQ